jgi:MFS family permease
MNGTNGKLWNKDFTILWQGQLISDIGNGIFMFVFGFWILALTDNNKILYGTVFACLSIPRVLFGPFAGTYADRHSRKWIIVFADLFRGVLFVLLAIVALNMKEELPIYVLFAAAIVSGLCSAFFSPAIISAIPDIVPMSKLTKANSLRTFSNSAGTFIGYALGGSLLGLMPDPATRIADIPLIVLGYGVCFLYASITQFFMRIQAIHKHAEKKHILREMIEGLKYTLSEPGRRTLIIVGMFLNFFVYIGMTLLTPLFNETDGYGALMLGLVMGTMMMGQICGMLFISFLKFNSKDRPKIFYTFIAVLIGCMIPVGLVFNVHVMFPLAFFIGVSVAVVVTLMYTLLQVTVPAVSRGRVFGVMSTVFEGLNPIAPILGGVISSVLPSVYFLSTIISPVRLTIVGAFLFAALMLAYVFFNRSFRTYLKSEPVGEDNDEASVERPEPGFPKI